MKILNKLKLEKNSGEYLQSVQVYPNHIIAYSQTNSTIEVVKKNVNYDVPEEGIILPYNLLRRSEVLGNCLKIVSKDKTPIPDTGSFDHNIIISSGNKKLKKNVMFFDAADLAIFNRGDKALLHTVSITLEELKQLYSSTSKEKLRYYLNGIGFVDGSLNTTDGHRLTHLKKPAFPESIKDSKSVIMHNEMIELMLATKEPYFDIQIFRNGVDTYNFKVETKDYIIESNGIDGTYPDIFRVIPDFADLEHITSQDFTEFLNKATKLKHTSIYFDKNNISSKDGSQEEYKEALEECFIEDEDFKGCFSLAYFKACYEKGDILFLNKVSDAPSIIQKSNDLLTVLMPRRG